MRSEFSTLADKNKVRNWRGTRIAPYKLFLFISSEINLKYKKSKRKSTRLCFGIPRIYLNLKFITAYHKFPVCDQFPVYEFQLHFILRIFSVVFVYITVHLRRLQTPKNSKNTIFTNDIPDSGGLVGSTLLLVVVQSYTNAQTTWEE